MTAASNLLATRPPGQRPSVDDGNAASADARERLRIQSLHRQWAAQKVLPPTLMGNKPVHYSGRKRERSGSAQQRARRKKVAYAARGKRKSPRQLAPLRGITALDQASQDRPGKGTETTSPISAKRREGSSMNVRRDVPRSISRPTDSVLVQEEDSRAWSRPDVEDWDQLPAAPLTPFKRGRPLASSSTENPRLLQSFLVNFLDEDTGTLKSNIDLSKHARDGGT
eukprot:CAMPEP_0202087172 /NCGR_PEP_ID=MMETSP0964-20121228/35471_1 /ASSEMBLY_ACC=CAM_ASM_000500 /TAXON_ID=4773 /ORGANISM="Schizochytrium aggregatum, Strain ATCC28209" /LENGTH=224 /DNA_ID=CAMNT_0048655115 /DNA_START=100 /DNA_END=771 /DNA_ORIENTATION=+